MDEHGASWQAVALRQVPVLLRVGVYAAERAAAQRLTIDVALYRRAGAFTGTSLADCVDYDRLRRWLIEELPDRPHVELLETLGEAIVAECLADRRIEACRVVIRKIDAYAGAGWPELEVWRRRDG